MCDPIGLCKLMMAATTMSSGLHVAISCQLSCSGSCRDLRPKTWQDWQGILRMSSSTVPSQLLKQCAPVSRVPDMI